MIIIYFLQLSPFEGAEEDFDMTIFPVGKDRSIGAIEGLVLNLVKDQQRYYDTQVFFVKMCLKETRISTVILVYLFQEKELHRYC